jgi:Domain of unknown function (DUF4203)
LIYFGIAAYFCYLIEYGFYSAFGKKINNSIYCLIICLVIFMLIFGYILYKLFKHVIIFSTSIIGGYMVVRGSSVYLGKFPNEAIIFNLIQNNEYDQLLSVKIILNFEI